MPIHDPKKTKTKTKIDISPELDDLDSAIGGFAPTHIPDEKSTPTQDTPASGHANLNRATRDQTRNVRLQDPRGQMRDYINRIQGVDTSQEPDLEHEFDNDLDNAHPIPTPGEIEPREPTTLPVLAQRVPALLRTEVGFPRGQEIKWHLIGNLPGYQQKTIRAMGRAEMAKRTRTPLQDITCIAHLSPQAQRMLPAHPGQMSPPEDPRANYNTLAELEIVARWLHENAENLGTPATTPHFPIPGYKVEVREYSAKGVRFHVVRDFMDENLMGYYVYAWPETDSVQDPRKLSNKPQLSNSSKKKPI